MKKIVQIKRVRELFYMYWTLTDFCNFKCNYCPKTLHSGDYAQGRTPGFPTNENIEQFLDNLINRHLQGRTLYLVLSGGEPTLHPMYETIIERCTPHGFVCTNTNGSRGIEWWEKLKVMPQQVTISLHPEFSKIDKINEVAHHLIERNVEMIFNLSCDPNNWDNTVRIYNELADDLKYYCVPKVLNHLESTRANYDYTPEQHAWMREVQRHYDVNQSRRPSFGSRSSFKQTWPNAYYDDGTWGRLPTLAQLTMTKQHDYKGWLCNAGMDTLNAHYDGNVWSSICKAVNLGRIESFEPLDQPIVCAKNYCTCPGDLIINKERQVNPAA
jgi:MoaA/NifB/PqqE/SkfB family radical SAM enzyme